MASDENESGVPPPPPPNDPEVIKRGKPTKPDEPEHHADVVHRDDDRPPADGGS